MWFINGMLLAFGVSFAVFLLQAFTQPHRNTKPPKPSPMHDPKWLAKYHPPGSASRYHAHLED